MHAVFTVFMLYSVLYANVYATVFTVCIHSPCCITAVFTVCIAVCAVCIAGVWPTSLLPVYGFATSSSITFSSVAFILYSLAKDLLFSRVISMCDMMDSADGLCPDPLKTHPVVIVSQLVERYLGFALSRQPTHCNQHKAHVQSVTIRWWADWRTFFMQCSLTLSTLPVPNQQCHRRINYRLRSGFF